MLGLAQWPLHAIVAIVEGAAVGRAVAVEAVTDPGDLLALPFTALAAVVA